MVSLDATVNERRARSTTLTKAAYVDWNWWNEATR
jgi:hypothetical protein